MSATLQAFLEQHAQLVPVAGNQRIDLTDNDAIWFVNTGKLDIFYGFEKPEHVEPRLHHLLRLEHGAMLFGFNLGGKRREARLRAGGSVGGSLWRLPSEACSKLTGEAGLREQFAAALDQWLTQLSAVLTPQPAPKTHQQLDRNDSPRLEKDEVWLCAETPRWLRLQQGTLQPFNRDDYPSLGPQRWFPVAGALWLQVLSAGEAETLPTAAMLQQTAWRQGLDAYHHELLAWLQHQHEQNERRISDRLDLKLRNEEKMVLATQQKFAAVTTPQAPEAAAAGGDVLLEACALVAEAASISINREALERRNASQPSLSDISRASGFRYRKVLLAGDWWRTLNGPLLAVHADTQTPLALLPKGRNRYLAVDLEAGESWPVTENDLDKIDPYGFMFYRPMPARPLGFKDLLAYGRIGIGGEILTLLLMSIAVAVLGLAMPAGIGLVFDTVIPQSKPTSLVIVGIGLLIAGLSVAAFSLVRGLALLRIEGKIGPAFQAAIWDRLLSLPVPFFRDYSSGDLLKRAMGIEMIQRELSGPAITTLITGVFSVLYLAQLLYYSTKLAVVALGLTALALIPLALSLVKVRIERRATEIEGRLTGLLLQLLNGIAKLRVSGSEVRAFSAWADPFIERKRLAYRAGMVEAMVKTWNDIFMPLANIVIFIFMMALQNDNQGLSVGQFIAFSSAFALFLHAALQLSDTAVVLLSLLPVYERTQPILKAEPETGEDGMADPGELEGDIEVSNLTFRYEPDGKAILSDLSFQIKPNEFVALVGPSGSGKSTLLRMLLGFEKPESGAVYYDGQELAGLDLYRVRRQIGIVLQNSQLVPGSIFSNIVGSLQLSEADAWRAAAMAGIDRDIREMPMGMHTEISEGGGTLSGGQSQRLMIARALANKPRILFFDEATSALDNQTQAVVTASLDSLKVTRVVIAHRLSTIRNADRIFVLVKGELVECGSYDELMQQGGVFYKLANRQIT